MKVLLLHPADGPPTEPEHFDITVDLARAPAATYAEWSRRTGSPVISLYDAAQEISDLFEVNALLTMGRGQVVDQWGIDWWDTLSLMLWPELLQTVLLSRLAKQLGSGPEIEATRNDWRASALAELAGGRLRIRQGAGEKLARGIGHYLERLTSLDGAKIFQIVQDKYDRKHRIRHALAGPRLATKGRFVLLPSNYVNVSRTCVAHAAAFPHLQFLLVIARRSAKLETVPPNVTQVMLDSYVGRDPDDLEQIVNQWAELKQRLASADPRLKAAASSGLLQKIRGLLPWGLAIRDAWNNVLDSHRIAGCLSADDSVPYSRIPLFLARHRGIPAVACHHGSMDCALALKSRAFDFYLAKNEMEHDYLTRLCRIPAQHIVKYDAAAHAPPKTDLPHQLANARGWLVFFSEPYNAHSWRDDEVYRELLPRLWQLAQTLQLKLVFKIHPFESVKQHRRRLRTYLAEDQARQVELLAGRISPELWNNARLAMAAESTVIIESARAGIPTFICSWLRDAVNGYATQYARFKLGEVLESADDIARVPELLRRYQPTAPLEIFSGLADRNRLDCLFGAEKNQPVGAEANPMIT